MAATKLMTAEDLYLMEDDGWRHELIRGELIRMPLGSFLHSKTAAWIATRLGMHVHIQRLGVVTGANGGYILGRDPDTVAAPDAAFVRADRVPEELPTYLELGPDFVVEVVTPYDCMNDETDKVRLYLDAGTQMVWVVQTSLKTVTIYEADRTARTLTTDDELDGGDMLPGFKLAVADIFK